MRCQTTLQQLTNLVDAAESGEDEWSDWDVDRSLWDHVERCDACRRRLDRLTDDPALHHASRRIANAMRLPESQALTVALDAVATLWSCSPEHCRGGSDDTNELVRLLDPPTQASELGTVGRYRIQAVLGRGGMSVVFAAWDDLLQRRVAIKVFSTHESERNWQRFIRESRAAADIEHPAVVPVYEVIERRNHPPALVMPLMSGGTLQQQLGRDPIRPREAAEITARIAAGLSEVHRRGHIHRDIKPGNILFDDDGQARLSDFSLVRRCDDEPLTEADVIPGTPEFIAPELLMGTGSASERSDIYQLGLTLYTMLCGVYAYQGTTSSVLRQILEGPPPHPSKRVDGIPKDLETICLKAIERQPDDRYATAQDFSDDLQRFLSGQGIAATRPSIASSVYRWAARRPATTAITVVALPAVMLLAAGYAIYHKQGNEFQHRAQRFQQQRTVDRAQLADETHRADLAELKSEQVLAQAFTAVFAAKQVREPEWVDAEKSFLTALLGGLEQAFAEMQLAPERHAAFGESALAVAKMRSRVDRTEQAIAAYQIAIDDFDHRLQVEPSEQLWQSMTDALRSCGIAAAKLGNLESANRDLKRATEIAETQANEHPGALKWQLESALAEAEYAHLLLAADDAELATGRFDRAAARINRLRQADGPRFNLHNFRELYADAIARVAAGYLQLDDSNRAIALQREAAEQNEQLGDDELSRLRQADSHAALAEMLVAADQVAEAALTIDTAIARINQAIAQSGQPERYVTRRRQWQQLVATRQPK